MQKGVDVELVGNEGFRVGFIVGWGVGIRDSSKMKFVSPGDVGVSVDPLQTRRKLVRICIPDLNSPEATAAVIFQQASQPVSQYLSW